MRQNYYFSNESRSAVFLYSRSTGSLQAAQADQFPQGWIQKEKSTFPFSNILYVYSAPDVLVLQVHFCNETTQILCKCTSVCKSFRRFRFLSISPELILHQTHNQSHEKVKESCNRWSALHKDLILTPPDTETGWIHREAIAGSQDVAAATYLTSSWKTVSRWTEENCCCFKA